ncbi:GNAT family N-acetyltransferase [Metabacillus iocasae]|uniref:RimJ/RimL family protein N-acetyltransferase n=1 Tax=Priestia iocasae TaxID=2291674 RepID=A0ABS2QVS7_9BACI|nr:GNAT family N-acetyltransferase [Metabacillus iocasae]MBM7703574.1 RimJ/RimL family protein N-acetyltransferase [Metabacillus iocasae]
MNPLLLDFSTEFETDKLLIRMPKPGDEYAVFEAVNESHADLKEWLIFAQKEQTLEDITLDIRKAQIAFLNREDLRFLVFLKETGELVGSSGLHRIDWSIPRFEIGYWINSRFSGKGYMTEAAKGITDFAIRELNARRIEIRCDSRNVKSQGVAERLGFTLEGILRQNGKCVKTGELIDTCVYSQIIN